MNIYTKVGDKGETNLKGKMVSKSSDFIEMLGHLDEAQAYIGLLNEKLKGYKHLTKVTRVIYEISGMLYLDKYETKALEAHIDEMEKEIDILMRNKNIKSFVLPEGSESIAHTHIARAVARRAERSVVRTKGDNNYILMYLNRLSDYLFAIAIDLKGGL